jgi:hypothetical protein
MYRHVRKLLYNSGKRIVNLKFYDVSCVHARLIFVWWFFKYTNAAKRAVRVARTDFHDDLGFALNACRNEDAIIN